MQTAAVSIRDVYKSFKNVKAVKGVSLTIEQGSYTALLGPNGAGKTTLIEMIEGIQKPDKGDIAILGKTWGRDDRQLHYWIGLSLQETKFIEKLSVSEIMDMFISFYNFDKNRKKEILSLVNLEQKEKSNVEHLSGGQRQRLALGIALINKPKLLLLDEPTTGLDPTARRELWDILQNLKKESATSMILTTHYMEEAQVLCDRIVIMDQGSFIADGTLSELISKFGEGDVIDFKLNGEVNDSSFESVPGFKKIRWEEKGIKGKLIVSNIAESLPDFMNKISDRHISFLELEARKMTLDDLFLTLTGRRLYE